MKGVQYRYNLDSGAVRKAPTGRRTLGHLKPMVTASRGAFINLGIVNFPEPNIGNPWSEDLITDVIKEVHMRGAGILSGVYILHYKICVIENSPI